MKQQPEPKELTDDEKRWLAAVLENIQLSGKPAIIKRTLETIDSIIAKLEIEEGAEDS